jgi:hypothetical protein
MLTDNQKKLIREEEIFRCEVRTELEKRDAATSMPGSLWGFVNSSFGLWLLSSVMLGSLGFLYGYVQDTRHTRRDAQERLSRLRSEITAHGWEFLGSLESAHDYTTYSNVFSEHLQRPKYKFSDFKDATMDQLLWEYRKLSRNPIKAQRVQDAIEWIWQDIHSMRGEVRLDDDKKYWFDHDMDTSLQELFFPSLKESR